MRLLSKKNVEAVVEYQDVLETSITFIHNLKKKL